MLLDSFDLLSLLLIVEPMQVDCVRSNHLGFNFDLPTSELDRWRVGRTYRDITYSPVVFFFLHGLITWGDVGRSFSPCQSSWISPRLF